MTVRVRTRDVGNDAAIAAEVRRTMSYVGIGASYQAMKFSDVPRGDALRVALADQVLPGLGSGKGITFVGETSRTEDAMLVAAKALHVCGVSVKVCGLVQFSSSLRDTDARADDEVAALFIKGFSDKGECPLLPYQRAMVEEELLDRLANARSVFPWVLSEKCLWWRPVVQERIAEHNVMFKCR